MNVHFQHKSDEWQTPQDLFDELNTELGPFDMDVAATIENAKCTYFATIEDDALTQDWMEKNWCNPPYSQVRDFAAKAERELKRKNNSHVNSR